MTEFEKDVAQAAVLADPAPLGQQQAQNVIEKLRQIEASRVEATITNLVNGGVLICENTMPPANAGAFSPPKPGSPKLGVPPFPPTFFKYTKGPKWED